VKTLSSNPESFFPNSPNERLDSYLIKPLFYLLAALLFGTALWYFAIHSDEPPAAATAPRRLELILSGVFTSNLSLSEAELKTVWCDSAGFHVVSTKGVVLPLALSLSGLSGENGSYQILGASSDFTLSIAKTTYTLQSGTVASSPGLRIFNASFVDAQNQPLLVSGRLSCP